MKNDEQNSFKLGNYEITKRKTKEGDIYLKVKNTIENKNIDYSTIITKDLIDYYNLYDFQLFNFSDIKDEITQITLVIIKIHRDIQLSIEFNLFPPEKRKINFDDLTRKVEFCKKKLGLLILKSNDINKDIYQLDSLKELDFEEEKNFEETRVKITDSIIELNKQLIDFHPIDSEKYHYFEFLNFQEEPCLFKNDLIFIGKSIGVIKVYNTKTNTIQMILKGHKKKITYLFFLNSSMLISSSEDSTIRIWEIQDNSYKSYILRGHTSSVKRVIKLSNDKILSCSDDRTIRTWKSSWPYNCLKIVFLKSNYNFPFSVIGSFFLEYFIYVSGYEPKDYSISFWDTENLEPIHKGGQYYINSPYSFCETIERKLFVAHGYLIFQETIISVINTVNFKIEFVFKNSILSRILNIFPLENGSVLCEEKNYLLYECSLESNDIKKIENEFFFNVFFLAALDYN